MVLVFVETLVFVVLFRVSPPKTAAAFWALKAAVLNSVTAPDINTDSKHSRTQTFLC